MQGSFEICAGLFWCTCRALLAVPTSICIAPFGRNRVATQRVALSYISRALLIIHIADLVFIQGSFGACIMGICRALSIHMRGSFVGTHTSQHRLC